MLAVAKHSAGEAAQQEPECAFFSCAIWERDRHHAGIIRMTEQEMKGIVRGAFSV